MRVALSRLPRVGRRLQSLGVDSVPAAGYFGDGWSIGNTLPPYWLETVLAIFLISARILIHSRLTRKAGHWNVAATTTSARYRKSIEDDRLKREANERELAPARRAT